jgi:hypothetical protein
MKAKKLLGVLGLGALLATARCECGRKWDLAQAASEYQMSWDEREKKETGKRVFFSPGSFWFEGDTRYVNYTYSIQKGYFDWKGNYWDHGWNITDKWAYNRKKNEWERICCVERKKDYPLFRKMVEAIRE